VVGEVKREKKTKRETEEERDVLALQAIALYVPSLEMKKVREVWREGGMHSILFLLLLCSFVFFPLSLSATLASLRSLFPFLSFLLFSFSFVLPTLSSVRSYRRL